jgi:streptogramin lyase
MKRRFRPNVRMLASRVVPALSITQVGAPTPGSMPHEIVSFGDTSYFTTPAANKIVNANKSGSFIAEYTVPTTNSEPFGATRGPASASFLWFTERMGNKIGWVDSLGTFHEFDVPTLASEPWGITAGPDGNIWFTEHTANKIGLAVISNNGTSVAIQEFALPTAASLPAGITAGPDGNVWFTEQAGRVGRITPAGMITEFNVPTPNSMPTQIVPGPDGALWFTETGGNRICHITTGGMLAETVIPTPGSQPMGITASPADVWFTESAANKIGRINNRGTLIEYAALTANSAPLGISADTQNNVWLTEPGVNKYASFVVPATIVTGADSGSSPLVRAFDSASNSLLYQFNAYVSTFTGGVRVATGDVNGDAVPDILTGAGPGGGPHVKLFDGKSGQLINEYFAFDASFHGGVYVALGDRISTKSPTGSYWETVVGAGPGGGPDVRVYKSLTGEMLSDFYAYGASFRGGVRVAAGSGIDNDPILMTGAGPGGGPHVKVVSIFGGVIHSFFAYDPVFTGGVYVSIIYDQGNGNPTLITGAGEGGGSHVRRFDGATAKLLNEFFAYDPSFHGGVRVGGSPLFSGAATATLVTGAGPSGGPDVKTFASVSKQQQSDFFAYDPSFLGGVFVAIG